MAYLGSAVGFGTHVSRLPGCYSVVCWRDLPSDRQIVVFGEGVDGRTSVRLGKTDVPGINEDLFGCTLFHDRYLPISGCSFSRVAAGMRLRSVSSADLKAERHLHDGVSPSRATALRISFWAFSLF